MEEQRCQCNHSSNWGRWVLAIIIACVITGFVVYNNTDKLDRLTGYKQPIEAQEVDTIMVYKEECPTIAEILQFRKDCLEFQRIDSVYLHMPEVVLIDILLQHGTCIENNEIVRIYENYPETYNLIQSGARAQRYLDTLNLSKPSKLPNTPRGDKPTESIDSILLATFDTFLFLLKCVTTMLVRENRHSLQKMSNMWGGSKCISI